MKLSRTARVALATFAYIALTLAYTWPLPANMMHGVAHDPGDPLLNAWILWWTTKAVPVTAAWWNAPMFYPAMGTFAFSEHLLGLAPVAAPLIALTGSPLLGYNVMLLASYVLSALGGYFLGYTLTKRHDAAFVAGLAFAFAPYRLAQVPHIQVLCAYWTPVCLAALHRYDRGGSSWWGILAAAAWFMQALSNGYYLLFSTVLLGLWLLWFGSRWPARRFAAPGLAFAAAALALLPILRGYQSILQHSYGFSRSLHEMREFSADVAGLFLASEDLLVWGWVQLFQRPESSLFPGITIVALAAFAVFQARPFATAVDDTPLRRRIRIALLVLLVLFLIGAALPTIYGPWRLTVGGVRLVSIARADKPLSLAILAALALLLPLPRVTGAVRQRSALAFYAIAAFAMWAFALGPDPTVFDRRFIYQAPYGQLMRLPGFDGLRVPARFWMMALVCFTAIAALAINRVAPARRRLVVVAAAIGLVLDGWPRVFRVVDEPGLRPSPAGVTTRLELPINSDIDAQAVYRQVFDQLPLHNGFSGYAAPHYYALQTLLDDRDPRILHELARNGALGVVIDHAGDPDGSARRFVLAYPGAVTARMESDWSSYHLPRSTAPPELPDRAGSPVRIASLSTFPSPPHAARALDGNLATRWSGGVQQQAADATIDLGEATSVGQLVIELGGFWTDFAKRLQIDVSADGAAWIPAWTGPTALHAYYAAVRHPREIPLVFPLHRDGVRYIRVRQTGWGTHDWSIAEIHVLR
jgi:hypothetical protein